MTRGSRRKIFLAVAILMPSLLVSAAVPVQAVDVRRAHRQRELPPTLRDRLMETLSDAAAPYLDAEDEKHSKGQAYVDFSSKFEYLPSYGSKGRIIVSAKMGGAEYKPGKSSDEKGTATGAIKYLVFDYKLEHGNWLPMGKPKWETQNLGPQATQQMTQAAQRAEKRKKAAAKSKQH